MIKGPLGQSELALRLGTELFRFDKPNLLVGRGPDCDISLPSGLVSRRHARVRLDGDSLVVEDLGSRNGVVVNSEQVSGQVRLKAGDTVVFGDQTLEVIHVPSQRSQTLPEMRIADTLVNVASAGPSDTTHQGNVFDLLGNVVDKQLALGRGTEAEKLLRGHLERTLGFVKEQRRRTNNCDKAASYAIKLAAATDKPEWIEYVLSMYSILDAVMPLELVDELYTLMRRIRVPVRLLRDYVAAMQHKSSRLSPAERFTLQRIAGLEQVMLL